ncbi:MAG TPA: hypothetical protein VMV17_01395 [Streptosporangiaceae bacterium]|nr:hypothetical protein [Streptosporangiaceae bacterium]
MDDDATPCQAEAAAISQEYLAAMRDGVPASGPRAMDAAASSPA